MRRFFSLFLLSWSALSALAQTTPTARYATVADMVAARIPAVPVAAAGSISALVTGRVTANDGGGGLFFFAPASATATNLGTVFPSTGVAGRWFRQYDGAVNAKWFGAVGNGSTDDTAAIQNALLISNTNNFCEFPNGNYSVTSPLTFYGGFGGVVSYVVTNSTSTRGSGVTFNRTGVDTNPVFRAATQLYGVTLRDFYIYIDGSAKVGIDFRYGGNQNIVRNLTIQGTASSSVSYGIYVRGVNPDDGIANSHQHSNRIEDCTVIGQVAVGIRFGDILDNLSLGNGNTVVNYIDYATPVDQVAIELNGAGSTIVNPILASARLRYFGTGGENSVIGGYTDSTATRVCLIDSIAGVKQVVRFYGTLNVTPPRILDSVLPNDTSRYTITGNIVSRNPVSTAYQSLTSDFYVPSTATLTNSLPLVLTAGSGRTITIKSLPGFTTRVQPVGADTIEGAASAEILTGGQTATYVGDGVSNWEKISRSFNSPLPEADGGTGNITNFTAGSVIFAKSGNQLAEDNAAFFYDASLRALVIGSTTSNRKLDVAFASSSGGGGLQLRNSSGGGSNWGLIVAATGDPQAAAGSLYLRNDLTGVVPFEVLSASGTINFNRDLVFSSAGYGLSVKEGANARMGRTALVNGTATVANTSVTASTEIFLTRRIQAGTTVGILSVGTVTAATSFVINSLDLAGALSADDDSTVNWLLVEPSP